MCNADVVWMVRRSFQVGFEAGKVAAEREAAMKGTVEAGVFDNVVQLVPKDQGKQVRDA